MTVHKFASNRGHGGMHYLGLKHTRPGAMRFKLKDYLDLDEIKVPSRFGHLKGGMSWQTLGNTVAGCCVVSGAAHEHMNWTHAAQGEMCTFKEQDILNVYRQQSGWNGRPDDPSDSGLDMVEFASYRRRTGLVDARGEVHKIDAYAEIESYDHLVKAAYVLGAVGTGIQFPDSASRQFDQHIPWVPVAGAQIEGGHYVPIMYRNSKNQLVCVTWGELQGLSREFWERYVMTSIGYLSIDYLNKSTRLSPEQFNEAQLAKDLAALAA